MDGGTHIKIPDVVVINKQEMTRLYQHIYQLRFFEAAPVVDFLDSIVSKQNGDQRIL